LRLSVDVLRNWSNPKVFQSKLKIESFVVTITWTSSDGFSGSRHFCHAMATRYPGHMHFFDFVHVLKEVINYLR
jgi:hypothetical protein